MAYLAPAVIANQTFSRNAIWSYVNVQAGPVRGPQPRLAQGSGPTGSQNTLPGNAPMLPGYLTDNEYLPVLFEYDTNFEPGFQKIIPKTIKTGNDGFELVGTYRAHDFVPGIRQLSHMRQADYYQVQEYPPNVRNLLAWQQVQRYRVNSFTMQARPLDQANYFLGYMVNPQIQGQIGQTTLGSMGSS